MTVSADSPAVTIVAEDSAWSVTDLTIPAGVSIRIQIDNRDTNISHNLVVRDPRGKIGTQLEVGPVRQELDLRIDAPGTLPFTCELHPGMVGRLHIR